MMPISDFCALYDVKPTAIRQKRFQEESFKKLTELRNNELWIDKNKVLKRYNFLLKVQNNTQEMYYYLNKHLNTSQIAMLLNHFYPEKSVLCWIDALSNVLFVNYENRSVLNYNIPESVWRMYRLFRWIFIYISRECELKFTDLDFEYLTLYERKNK